MRAVVKVGNYSGHPVTIIAPNVQLWQGTQDRVYDRHCYESTLNSGFVRACIGPLTYRPCGQVKGGGVVEITPPSGFVYEIRTDSPWRYTPCKN